MKQMKTNEQTRKAESPWQLVKVSDLPVPSAQELAEARRRWVDQEVWFLVGPQSWRSGKVYAITRGGEVKIAVRRGDAWVHGRVIRLEYVQRVLRLAREGGVQ